VLGLGLSMEGGRIRFFSGSAPLPEAEELIARLGKMVDDIVLREQNLLAELDRERERAEAARERAEAAREHAEAEHERAERLAQRLRELGVDPDADELTPR
jgi:hypothetical protein